MPKFSFLLPTRGRPGLVLRFLESVTRCTAHPEELEIVLAVDDDDEASQGIQYPDLDLRKRVIPRGAPMGELNRACLEASTGRFLMLVNDDILLRTPGWDDRVSRAIQTFPDDICLIHVNDLMFRERLCTFPLLSRQAVDAVGLGPSRYRRYRIDDHIFDVYNLLAHLGHRRILYLPDVIFEHENDLYVTRPDARASADCKTHGADPDIVDHDARLYDMTFPERKAAALRLADLIEEQAGARRRREREQALAAVPDSYSYRRSNYTQTWPFRPAATTRLDRTTVFLTTQDAASPQAQAWIARVKRCSGPSDLVILDHDRSPTFHPAREMNRVLSSVRTRYVAFLDEGAGVDPGWLAGLRAAMGAEAAVTVPLHTDTQGHVLSSGCSFVGDSRGTAFPLLDRPQEDRPVPTWSGSTLLLDLDKVGHLRMDESYSTPWFGRVLGLEVWEAGHACVVAPGVTVVHPADPGAWQEREADGPAGQEDRALFAERWVRSGRLEDLSSKVWSRYPAVDSLMEVPRLVRRAYRLLEQAPSPEIHHVTLALLVATRDMPPLALLIHEQLQQLRERRLAERDAGRVAQCVATERWLAAHADRIPLLPPDRVVAAALKVKEFLAGAPHPQAP